MNKEFIIRVLISIEEKLSFIYDDECSCNEGSLTKREYDSLIYYIHSVLQELLK